MRKLLAALGLLTLLLAAPAAAAPANPVIYLTGSESFVSGGQSFVRYRLAVLNWDAYPAELFAAAPDLPPCGRNASSSRTWIDIFDMRGRRLQGFCALKSAADLDTLWFSLEDGVVPPSYVYIEILDRRTGLKYRSNLADTTL